MLRDQEILDKVVSYWEMCASARKRGEVDGMWAKIVGRRHRGLTSALEGRDRGELLELLSNYWEEEFSYGFAQGKELHERFAADGEAAVAAGAARCVESIVAVAEAVGAIRRSKELRGPGNDPPGSVEELARKVSEETGVALGVDGERTGGMYGFDIGGKIISIKDIQSYLFAYATGKLRNDDAICEIGPGTGHSAYYHHVFGAERVYLFDLPSVSVVAIWVLSRIEGPEKICVYEEEPNDDHVYFVFPHWSFGNPAMRFMNFRTLVNKNSFPEMSENVASDYFRKSQVYGCDTVFSTNQELHRGQGRVSDAARSAGWKRIGRSPNWIRPSWIDEIFVAPGACLDNEGGPTTATGPR